MTDFSLPKNFIQNPEALLRKNRSRTSSSSATPPTNKPVASAPSELVEMAQKSLCEFSIPAVANVPTGPVVNVADKNFELRTGLITMVQGIPFCRLTMRMPTLTCSVSWSSVTLSSSRTSKLTSSGSGCFPSPLWERRSSGSIRTKRL